MQVCDLLFFVCRVTATKMCSSARAGDEFRDAICETGRGWERSFGPSSSHAKERASVHRISWQALEDGEANTSTATIKNVPIIWPQKKH